MAVYYVDQATGNDANAGTEASPWKTLHRATDGDPTKEAGGTGGPYTPVQAGDTVYVKNGTYEDITASAEGDPAVKFNPTNSGTSGSPIAFRAFSGHRPIVKRVVRPVSDPAGDENNQCIGAISRNFIIWDGFQLAPGTDVRIGGSNDCILERLLIDKGKSVGLTGNYSGIFLNIASRTTIRYCTFRNITFSDYPDPQTDFNAAGVKSFDGTDTIVHNCLFERCNTAIDDKQNGLRNIYERNYVRGTYVYGLLLRGQGLVTIADVIFRYNVVNSPGGNNGIAVLSDGDMTNIQIYNNTIYAEGAEKALVPQGGPEAWALNPSIKIYNNIVMRDPSIGGTFTGNQSYTTALPTDAGFLTDFNCFYGLTTLNLRFVDDSVADSPYTTLAAWQAHRSDLDPNSLGTDPLLIGPVSSSAPVTAFKLQASSPCKNAGRVGGVSGGAAVDMGAFLSSGDTIGPGLGVWVI